MFTEKSAVLNAFLFRHACKKYDPTKKISAEDFDFILEAARLSPSSFGLEPWRLLVLHNPAPREALRDIAWGAAEKIADCSHFVVLLSRKEAAMRSDYRREMWGGVHGMPSETVVQREILPNTISRCTKTRALSTTGRRSSATSHWPT